MNYTAILTNKINWATINIIIVKFITRNFITATIIILFDNC